MSGLQSGATATIINFLDRRIRTDPAFSPSGRRSKRAGLIRSAGNDAGGLGQDSVSCETVGPSRSDEARFARDPLRGRTGEVDAELGIAGRLAGTPAGWAGQAESGWVDGGDEGELELIAARLA